VPRMPLPAYYEQVAAIEAEREQLHRRLAITRSTRCWPRCWRSRMPPRNGTGARSTGSAPSSSS
jgi:hypothetical protein